jgi:lysophospholipase
MGDIAALAALVANAKRALPNNPTGGYTPAFVSCPADRPEIREADGLSPNETAWLQLRRNQTIAPMIDFLTRMNISGFDAATYINSVSGNASTLPNIGIAVSGGGYRAMLIGAGFLAVSFPRSKFSFVPFQGFYTP